MVKSLLRTKNGTKRISKKRKKITGGTPKDLLALSVYAEVQIAKQIKLPVEALIRKVTRGIEIAYKAFEDFEEEK